MTKIGINDLVGKVDPLVLKVVQHAYKRGFFVVAMEDHGGLMILPIPPSVYERLKHINSLDELDDSDRNYWLEETDRMLIAHN